jgi:uncharacterized membrane protein
MVTLIHFIHLLSLVMWMGSIIFFSFFTAPAVFRLLDRQKAGEVVGAIFPKYYAIGYICSVLAAATLMLSPRGMEGPPLIFLTVMAACTFYAGLVINPQARVLKQQMLVGPPQCHRIDLRPGPAVDHCPALNVIPTTTADKWRKNTGPGT